MSELAQGREVMATRKDKQEVLNYLKVLEDIDKLTDDKKIIEKGLLNIHKLLTQGPWNELAHTFEKRHNENFRGIVSKRFENHGNLEKDLFVYWFLLVKIPLLLTVTH